MKPNHLIEYNPFRTADYEKTFVGKFAKSRLHAASMLCVRCLACTFKNVAKTPYKLVHTIDDHNLYFWFLQKSILFIKNVKYIDMADSAWLAVTSQNFKILCLTYIIHCRANLLEDSLTLACTCDSEIPAPDVFAKAASNYIAWVEQYSGYMGDDIVDVLFRNFSLVPYNKARQMIMKDENIVYHNVESLRAILNHGIFNKDVTEPVENLHIHLLSWINTNNVPISSAMTKWMHKNIDFYKGFYMQPFWHDDESSSANKTRFWFRWRNRFTHPRWRRNFLKKKLIYEVKEWLNINYDQLDLDLNVEYFSELFWLSIIIDALAKGAKGKFIVKPPSIHGSLWATKLKRKVERI
jgi:hypothetical protein